MNKCNKKHFNTYLLSLTVFIALLIAYSLPLNATIRYVSKTGNSTPPYLTWETAADSIQKCINISVFGDTIYVANGVYQGQVVMIPGLSLIGAGMDSCIIYLANTGIPAVQIKDTCLLKGFKILLPNTLNTWGIKADTSGVDSKVTLNKIVNASLGIYVRFSNPFVYNNNFENIKTRGIWLFNSNSITRRNSIYTDPNSQAGQITGIYIDAFTSSYQPIIDSNYIETNGDGISKSIGANPLIKNNVIILNGLGSEGIRVSSSDSTKAYNNLIVAKAGIEASDGIINYGVQYLHNYNNVIKGDYYYYVLLMGSNDKSINNAITNAEGWIAAYAGGDFRYNYNNVWKSNIGFGFTPDTTNLSVDPMVVNDDTTQGDLDFHLQMFSPLINTGDPTILDKDSTRSDIGLYGGLYGESYLYFDLPPRTPVNLTANVDSLIKLNWNKNTEADFSFYNVYRDTVYNFTVDSTKLIASVADTFYYETFPSNIETLYYKLTAVDNQDNESNPSEQVAVVLVNVKNEWVPVNNYILYQNYPNPFNPSTKIGYKLKERGYVKLYIYDIKGELVSVLVNEVQEAGYYEVEFDTGSPKPDTGIRSLASGVYIYQIFVKGDNNIPVFSDIKKMLLVK